MTLWAVALLLLNVGVATADSPVAAWSFSEGSGADTADSAGGLTGHLSGSVSWISDGVAGHALHFSGGRVTVADSPVLRSATFGARLWVRGDPNSPPADGQVIMEKGDQNCAGGAYALVVDGGHVALRYLETYPYVHIQTLTIGNSVLPSLWDGAWHLVGFDTFDDDWGYVMLYQQGWVVGPEPAHHALVEQGLTPSSLNLGGAANSACNEAAFTGDIDEVAFYSHLVTRDELAAAEPQIPTTISIDSVGALAVGKTSSATVHIAPLPFAPGTVSASLVDPDGVEHGVGSVKFDGAWQLPADGKVVVPIQPGTTGTLLKVRWLPSLPQIGSEAEVNVTVAKASTQATLVTYINTYIENEPIDFSVRVSSTADVKVSGPVRLYDQTASGPILIDTQPAISPVGSLEAWAQFSLPARTAGTYELSATYGGSSTLESSYAPTQEIVVNPALVPGAVLINNGDETTDSEYVTVAIPAVGAAAVQLSLDPNSLNETYPPIDWAETVPIRLYYLDQYANQDGLKTVWVRYADALGRWTDWNEAYSDSITLDRGLESGSFSLDNGAAVTDSHTVIANVAVADPTRVATVQLSNDGTTWKTLPYAPSVSWDVAAGDGQHTVDVRWVDSLGRESVGATDSIGVDTVAPTVGPITVALDNGARPTTTVPLRLTWTGSDGGGIAGYDVASSRDGGLWKTIASGTPTPSLVTAQAAGHSYRFRVRGRDQAGNVSAWQLDSASKLSAIQEASGKLTYTGTWSKASAASYWGGASKYSTKTNASATVKFIGRSIAWSAPTGPTSGQARVYVDGQLDKTINLWAATQSSSQVVYQRSWTASGSHKIRIEVVGTAGHSRVDIDGFVVFG